MRKNYPKVSIGMPVYNGGKFIREAIDSLLNQTFCDFELIISDNASTDDTGNICLEYVEKDARVRYVRQKENIGASENFVYVVTRAAGDYFMWAAADDIWSHNWLEVLVKEKNTEDMSVMGMVTRIGKVASDQIMLPRFKRFSFYKFFLWKGNKAFYVYGLYERKKLQAIAELLPKINCRGADDVWLLHNLKYGGYRSVSGWSLFYRVHDEQMSNYQVDVVSKLINFFGTFLLRKYYFSITMVPLRNVPFLFFLIPVDYVFRLARIVKSYFRILL